MGCSYILAVIDDFDLFWVCVSPKKTNSPLVIDSNAVLAFPIVFKPLKAISRQGSQICQVHARFQREVSNTSRRPLAEQGYLQLQCPTPGRYSRRHNREPECCAFPSPPLPENQAC